MAHYPPPVPRFYDWPPHWADLARRIDRLAEIVLEMGAKIVTDQEHLEADVAAVGGSIAAAVAELKAQIAAGVPATALDFTTFDALAASTAAEAAADAPPVPPGDGSPAL